MIYRTIVYNPLYEFFKQKINFFSSILDLPEVEWKIKCSKGDILVDLGANIGDITSRLARTRSKVYAFEPDPVAFKILSRRFRLVKNVICVNKGVMAAKGRLELYPCNPNNEDRIQSSVGSSFLAQKNNNTNSLGFVECICFADFIYELNHPIKFVKIDIEGAEVELLESIIDSGLYEIIDKIAVETHEHQIPALLDATEALKKKISAHKLSEKINLGWV